ncbi:hypothetical protein GWR56_04380 [Mucilaginibacter sp. 14171R-50]|uniref:hypothetical protein n=1 Tax=Mucilaginibacter sp. 14171R-50 TaxID=2703789 RepID=UPI00138B5D4B|nr:hypothetical protein [Mucilaginibacter sp. 14171R-50]QHS54818.1 hypothetical protein GWR56_04380 [Mucilaginibacter sp. 14171R-50]
MKFSFKIIMFALCAVIALNVSCKKTDTAVAPIKNGTTDNSKQIAIELYRSLRGSVNNGKTLKADAEQSGTKTITTTQECGMVFTTFTDSTGVKGDTTRKYVGKRIFTNMCNGAFSNNWNVDAYLLADTLKTTEKGTGFNNIYDVTLNYDVRALNTNYSEISINGVTTTSSFKSKVSGGVTTEYHQMETVYSLLKISAFNNSANPLYKSGRVYFNTKTADKDAGPNAKVNTNAYNGYMEFYPNNTMRSYFDLKNGSYKVFEMDLITGEVKAL